jgi:hypothetical protein
MRFQFVIASVLALAVASCHPDSRPAVRVIEKPEPEEEMKLELPKSFPADFPLYPGAVLEQVGKESGTFSLGYKTEDPYDKVEKFFREEPVKNGWKVTPSTSIGGLLLTITKGKNELRVTLGRAPTATHIGIALAIPREEEPKEATKGND